MVLVLDDLGKGGGGEAFGVRMKYIHCDHRRHAFRILPPTALPGQRKREVHRHIRRGMPFPPGGMPVAVMIEPARAYFLN